MVFSFIIKELHFFLSKCAYFIYTVINVKGLHMRGFNLKSGFTMIELLVVIVIIGVLAVSMIPVVGRFLKAGDDTISRNNLMRLGRAAIAYRSDHGSCYPAAGGYFTKFSIYTDGRREERYGRARGWVYFEHECPRANGDIEAADKIGDGNHGSYGYGIQLPCGSIDGDEVNEEGCCLCFNSKTNEGGISARPASWYGRSSGAYSPAEVAVRNGALFQYVNTDISTYSNPAFDDQAQKKLGIPRSQVTRAYAMNVIAGTDEDLYDTGRPKYHNGGMERDYCHPEGQGHQAIRLGQSVLRAYESSSENAEDFHEVVPARTVLFVELDLDNDAVSQTNSLEGDQVWDWDGGDESMGFNHEDGGSMFAHVCFADGHVEAIRDPSPDPTSPDMGRRQKLSKWYGSGGVNASGEKLD